MKKLILLAIITGLFSLNVHADRDSALEAREAAPALVFCNQPVRRAGSGHARSNLAEFPRHFRLQGMANFFGRVIRR